MMTAAGAAESSSRQPASRRFLIAGCQRSGTTMMRLILESHRDVQCFDEQYSYEILAGRVKHHEPTSPVVGFKIPVWSEQLLQAELHWNEYSYQYGNDPVPNFYGREPLIFMVRSPLDTVSSMMKLKVESDSWLQRVGLPVLNSMAEEGRLSEQSRADLEFASSCECPDVAMGALYWKIKSSAALDYIEAGLPVQLVIYERFVGAPTAFLPGILRHIGVDWDESVLLHHERPHGELVDGKAIGDTDPNRPIDTHSIGHSSISLSASQMALVEKMAGDLEKRLRSQAS